MVQNLPWIVHYYSGQDISCFCWNQKPLIVFTTAYHSSQPYASSVLSISINPTYVTSTSILSAYLRLDLLKDFLILRPSTKMLDEFLVLLLIVHHLVIDIILFEAHDCEISSSPRQRPILLSSILLCSLFSHTDIYDVYLPDTVLIEHDPKPVLTTFRPQNLSSKDSS
jgi:hypothetical protein